MNLTEMVNREFASRYRVEELIGIGAVSAVYTAYDPVEGRWVALKTFDAELAADERFPQRLVDAVEQAAVLGHNNIVEIYDWGIDDGPFIISELCEGGSLASMIDAGARLESSQALVMALECSRALDYAHDQGVVHRNLTPSNILFSADGKVKIADYGLAEVLANAPATHASAHPTRALDKVRYSSPEQARGRVVGEPSDVYSLALIVNEAVSGLSPAVADTVVGTLMQRAEASADLDASLQGLLPSLERCGRVDAAERPEAGELSIALLAAAETMERPDELPLVGLVTPNEAAESTLLVAGGQLARPEVDLLQADTPDAETPEVETTELDSRDAHAAAATTADEGVTEDSSDDAEHDSADGDGEEYRGVELVLVESDSELAAAGTLENLEAAEPVFAPVFELVDEVDEAAELDVPEPALARRSAAVSYDENHDDADDRLPWWPLLLLGLLVAGVVAAGVYFFVLDPSDDAVAVPDLLGVEFDDVASEVDGRWQIERLEGRVDGSVVGTVVSQSPAAGAELEPDEVLTVTVSLGNEMVEIPSDIVGLTVDQAASRLNSVGLGLGRITEEQDEALAAGLVLGLNEPTTQKPSGQTVALRVSGGPEDRFVPPEVVGMTIGDATTLLVGLRLQAIEEAVFSPDVEEGIVIGISPEPGSVVPADSAITLLVSAGPEPVVMPDIVGLALDEAIDELEALGLIFIDTEGTPGQDVIGSLPPIGATVDVGTEVLVYLDDPPEDE